MGVFKVPMSYINLKKKEETITTKIEQSNIDISVSPIPETNKALISIIEEREPLILNQICTLNEFVMRKIAFPVGFTGDFIFLSTSTIDGEFDINRLGVDLFLFYVDGDNYEG